MKPQGYILQTNIPIYATQGLVEARAGDVLVMVGDKTVVMQREQPTEVRMRMFARLYL